MFADTLESLRPVCEVSGPVYLQKSVDTCHSSELCDGHSSHPHLNGRVTKSVSRIGSPCCQGTGPIHCSWPPGVQAQESVHVSTPEIVLIVSLPSGWRQRPFGRRRRKEREFFLDGCGRRMKVWLLAACWHFNRIRKLRYSENNTKSVPINNVPCKHCFSAMKPPDLKSKHHELGLRICLKNVSFTNKNWNVLN